MNKSLIMALALVSLAAVAHGQPVAVVSDAWVRALPPGQPNTAAYLTLTNPGKTEIAVVAGSTELAARVEFHTTREVAGLQRMEQLEQLELAPGQTLVLAPGGTHLMLLGLDKMPVPGDSVPLCLQLSTGGEVCTTAEVRKTASSQPQHEHHQHK